MCTMLFISTSGLSDNDALFTHQNKLLINSITILSALPSDIIFSTVPRFEHCTLYIMTCNLLSM